MIRFLDRNRIFVLTLLGAVVRLLYGYCYQLWDQAPDHIAWELVIEQGSWSYDHLIHYPHEGGTILISLLSRFVELFTNLSSLAVSAILIDSAVRFIQISIVKRVFNVQVATLFGLWTIFAIPSIIPWGTISFGLHSVSSVFPFIFLFLLSQQKDTLKYYLVCGLVLGLAFWFSYSNAILIPVFFLFLLVSKANVRNWLYSLSSLFLVLACHYWVRQSLDAGFHLVEFGLVSIRGEMFSFTEIDVWDRLGYLPNVVANSALALPGSDMDMPAFRSVYYFTCILAGVGLGIAALLNRFEKHVYYIFPIVLIFLVLYLFSPFYHPEDEGNYILFRHLSYIMPLFSLLLVAGLSSLRYKIFVVLFLLLGVFRPIQLFTLEKPMYHAMATKATGWVLATKLGHDPEALTAILKNIPERRDLIIQGIGTGIAACLMRDVDVSDEVEVEAKVRQLVELYRRYPASDQGGLLEGIRFSFTNQVDPRLNKKLLVKIEAELDRPAGD